ncbi:uncharacterized protein N7459_002856 [Penicillium hispanicum]|uniref:uncharacterized protein n=1 Tax=Penicillium hispanicum TaxID=1080232 RepID=UPI002540E6B7|nr:uncharacterized protein N7459_002856 [Penicillium hispanicum]KAJ5587091.1 hypothetical protein N7459_002856 [Penicillium hispanicum]
MSTDLPEAPPSISMTATITPAKFSADSQPPPTITLTVISHYPEPITIFTLTTIFNLRLGLFRSDFTCHDITIQDVESTPLVINYTKGPKRSGVSRELGGRDDQYFVTLDPMIPVEFKRKFSLRNGAEDSPLFQSGHRYRLGIKRDRQIGWWWFGKKEDVMAPPGTAAPLEPASGGPITLEMEGVEFEFV